jgi:glycosyltransferase involved in cell wall biosynthesis
MGLGFIFDEFLYWTRFRFDYWNFTNIVAITGAGLLLGSLYIYLKREHRLRPIFKNSDLSFRPENPKISVIIPAFNEAGFIGDCLKSLKEQAFNQHYEIIVVDNNSKDRTGQVAANYGARVVVEQKQGVSFARQRGAMEADGDIIVSTDADCVFPPDWLQNIYNAFIQNEKAIAVIGPFEFMPIPKWGKWLSVNWFKLVKTYYRRQGKILYVPAANFAYLKSALNLVGGYDTNLTQGGDEYGLLRKLVQVGKVVYLPENKIVASSRRLAKGFLHSAVYMFGYYYLDYFVATRITGKSVFGQAKPLREEPKEKKMIWKILQTAGHTAIFLSVLFFSQSFRTEAAEAKNTVFTNSKKITWTVGRHFAHFKRTGLSHYYHKQPIKSQLP